jgi:hypothetical protein
MKLSAYMSLIALVLGTVMATNSSADPIQPNETQTDEMQMKQMQANMAQMQADMAQMDLQMQSFKADINKLNRAPAVVTMPAGDKAAQPSQAQPDSQAPSHDNDAARLE